MNEHRRLIEIANAIKESARIPKEVLMSQDAFWALQHACWPAEDGGHCLHYRASTIPVRVVAELAPGSVVEVYE